MAWCRIFFILIASGLTGSVPVGTQGTLPELAGLPERVAGAVDVDVDVSVSRPPTAFASADAPVAQRRVLENYLVSTDSPSAAPTRTPSMSPTRTPSYFPSRSPTQAPTFHPTRSPTRTPSMSPTRTPSHEPTRSPTAAPTHSPTTMPTYTESPTIAPTRSPSTRPSPQPTMPPSSPPHYMMDGYPTPRPTPARPTGVYDYRAPTPASKHEYTPTPTADDYASTPVRGYVYTPRPTTGVDSTPRPTVAYERDDGYHRRRLVEAEESRPAGAYAYGSPTAPRSTYNRTLAPTIVYESALTLTSGKHTTPTPTVEVYTPEAYNGRRDSTLPPTSGDDSYKPPYGRDDEYHRRRLVEAESTSAAEESDRRIHDALGW